MSGTKEGGLKAAKINKKKYGENFYKNIGQKGGFAGRGGGFAATGYGQIAGKIGGMKAANKRYGTPIDEDLMREYRIELKRLKAMRKYAERISQ
jgi:hypothetical protein